jgi:hypothetical protein
MTLSTASINGFTLSPDRRTLSVQTAPPDIPGAWILSSQLTTPDGRPASAEPATGACGPNALGTSCEAYIESLHLRQKVTYQPASRYWPLQWYETGIYLAVALAWPVSASGGSAPTARRNLTSIAPAPAGRPPRSKGPRDLRRSQRTGEPSAPIQHRFSTGSGNDGK